MVAGAAACSIVPGLMSLLTQNLSYKYLAALSRKKTKNRAFFAENRILCARVFGLVQKGEKEQLSGPSSLTLCKSLVE